MTFQALGLSSPILKALAALGYESPTPIQEKAIPPALAGRDVLGCAQTGTGKTCAFAAPILQRLNKTRPEGRPVRALILTPTRELALQIYENLEQYGANLPLRSAVIFGGVGQQPQVDALRRGVDILVATPGRLLDLQGQGLLDLHGLEIFVLDEADRMLDMGFIHDVRRIIALLPARRQTLFFSATMPGEVMELVDSLLTDPVRVAVDPVSSPVEIIDQSVCFVDKGNKTRLLAELLAAPGVRNALVFTRTKHGANKVAGDLGKSGIPAAAIHGNKSQSARQQALADFKDGKIRALVATDIAARGLDIEELSHVFNYNLPEVPETYVHRIGRTGRAGHGGTAVSFCDFAEQEYLRGIEKLLGKKIPVVEDHPYPMENFSVTRDAKGRIVNADDAEARSAARERHTEKRTAARKTADAASKTAALVTAKLGQALKKGGKSPAKDSADAKAESARTEVTAPPAPVETAPKRPESAPKKQEPKKADALPKKQEPKKTGAAPKKPEAAPKKTGSTDIDDLLPPRPSHRGVRQQRLEDTLPADPQLPVADFEKPDPLAGDVIMDATARLLAPRPLTLSHGSSGAPRKSGTAAAPKKQEPKKPESAPKKQENAPRKQESAPKKQESAPKKQESAPKKQESAPKKQESAPKKQENVSAKAAPGSESAAPKKKKHHRGGHKSSSAQTPQKNESAAKDASRSAKSAAHTDAPAASAVPAALKKKHRSRSGRPAEPSLRPSTQKDSTEQKSLMKPYYLTPDD